MESLGSSARAGTRAIYQSVNPANLSEVVAEVALSGRSAVVGACAGAKDAQRAWADVPAPVRGQVIANIGRLVEANAEALARLVTREVGKPLAEARGEVQEIVDTCDFFLGEGRRLYGQTVPSEMPDKQLFTFRDAGRRRHGDHGRQLPGRRARPGTSCRRCCAATRWCGSRPSTPPRSPTRCTSCSRAAGCPTACSTWCTPTARRPSPGCDAALSRGPGRQGRLHRLDRGRPARSASCAGGTCSRPAWSWAARTRWWSRRTPTSTSPSRARSSPASARPGSAAPRSARVIVHESRARRVPRGASPPPSAAPRSATRRADVLYGPMLDAAVRRAVREVPRTGSRAHHRVLGSTGPAGSPRTTRAPASSAIPDAGCTTTR